MYTRQPRQHVWSAISTTRVSHTGNDLALQTIHLAAAGTTDAQAHGGDLYMCLYAHVFESSRSHKQQQYHEPGQQHTGSWTR
jgi:hypothetical protein